MKISHQSGGDSIWSLDLQNNFRFKKGFNIASTTNEHIHIYLNYYSVGFLDHVLLIY